MRKLHNVRLELILIFLVSSSRGLTSESLYPTIRCEMRSDGQKSVSSENQEKQNNQKARMYSTQYKSVSKKVFFDGKDNSSENIDHPHSTNLIVNDKTVNKSARDESLHDELESSRKSSPAQQISKRAKRQLENRKLTNYNNVNKDEESDHSKHARDTKEQFDRVAKNNRDTETRHSTAEEKISYNDKFQTNKFRSRLPLALHRKGSHHTVTPIYWRSLNQVHKDLNRDKFQSKTSEHVPLASKSSIHNARQGNSLSKSEAQFVEYKNQRRISRSVPQIEAASERKRSFTSTGLDQNSREQDQDLYKAEMSSIEAEKQTEHRKKRSVFSSSDVIGQISPIPGQLAMLKLARHHRLNKYRKVNVQSGYDDKWIWVPYYYIEPQTFTLLYDDSILLENEDENFAYRDLETGGMKTENGELLGNSNPEMVKRNGGEAMSRLQEMLNNYKTKGSKGLPPLETLRFG